MKEKRKKDEIWQAITCRFYQNLCSNMQLRWTILSMTMTMIILWMTILSMTMTMIILWMTILSMTDHPGFHSHWSSCGLRKHKTRWSGGFLGRCPRKVSFHVLDKKILEKLVFILVLIEQQALSWSEISCYWRSALKKWDFMLLNDEPSITKTYLLHTCSWHTTQSLKESECKNKRRICQQGWSASTKQRFHWNVRNSRSGGSGGEAEEEKNKEQRSREHRELAGRERGEGEEDEDEDVGEFVLKSQPLLGGSGREGGDVKSKKTKTFQDPSKKRLLWDKAKLSPGGPGF